MPIRPHSGSKSKYPVEVVEAVLQIMEQGPQPMRDMRPTKKNPNGADHFRSDHQAEYETYEYQEGRSTQYVDNHNAASPKMIDELQKRRSTARPSANVTTARRKPTNQIYFDPHCDLCQKLKLAMESKKRTARTKPRPDKRRKPEKKSKVSKSRPKRPQRNNRSTFKLSRIRRNVGVQYCYQSMNRGTACFGLNDGTPDDQAMSIYFSNRSEQKSTSRNSQAALTNPPQSENGSKSLMSQNPDTSANSLSSYNSNMSLDQEPMVSR